MNIFTSMPLITPCAEGTSNNPWRTEVEKKGGPE
jgi:hypothetical protein